MMSPSKRILGLMVMALVILRGQVSGIIEIGTRSCPDISGQATFDPMQYTGVWFEYEKFAVFFERNLKCVTAEYTLNEDGSIKVENGGININTDEEVTAEATATVPDSDKPAELKVRFSRFDFSRRANYIVVDTDYINHAVVYSCFKIPLLPVTFQYLWILTRSRGVAPPAIDAIKGGLERSGIIVSLLYPTDQTSCEGINKK